MVILKIMIMNSKFKSFLLFTFIVFTTVSCSKKETYTEDEIKDLPEGYSLVKIDLPEITIQEESLNGNKNANAKLRLNNESISSNKIGTSENGFLCNVTLSPDSKSASFKSTKLAQTITKSVDAGVRYRLYAFDKTSGNLVDSATYIRGEEKQAKDLRLIGGKDYIFVAYSNNSKLVFPSYLSQKQNISTAEIINADVDFMFFKDEMHIPPRSSNTLKIKFRHTFSQITTIIKLDSRTAKYTSIKGISNASFIRPSFETTKFKVSNERISGIKQKSLGSNVSFPAIKSTDNITEIRTPTPTIINSPENDAIGQLIIESLTIGNITRGNLIVENLKLTPGVKYNLELTFYVPPTQEVLDPSNDPYFKYYQKGGNGDKHVEYTVNLTNPTFGAQLDIFYLDNSFQLYVNDSPVFSKEINFEDYLKTDVEFSDGTWYGKPGSGITQIYWLNDKERKEVPVIRLVIDEEGKILLYGRKSLTDELRLLKLRSGVTYSPVKFDPKGTNKLRFYSTIWNITDVWGRIYGIQAK